MDDSYSDFETEEKDFLESLREHPSFREKGSGQCPAPRLLIASQADALDDERRTVIRAHIDGCMECRILLQSFAEAELPEINAEEVDRLYFRIRGKLPVTTQVSWRRHSFRIAWSWKNAPALAALFIAAALGLWYRQLQRNSPPPIQSPTSSVPAGVDLALLVPLDPPPVELPLDALLTRRSFGQDRQTLYIRKLAAALAPFKTGGYALAAPNLEQVAAAHPDAPEAHFYYGVCLILTGSALKAVEELSHTNLYAETKWQRRASWYLAIARLRVGDTMGALDEFRQLCATEGEQKQSACDAIQRIRRAVPNIAGR